jgi:DNA polymerase I-like protein with 3'-5' exonuclease and polymerase domains
MTTIVNVADRPQFDALLKELSTSPIIVFDTETTGLDWHKDHWMVSMSFYFPESDTGYNVPFRHGMRFNEDQRRANLSNWASEVAGLSWTRTEKLEWFFEHWFAQYHEQIIWGNLPLHWLTEISAVWGRDDALYMGHNVKFDLHVLSREGFNTPPRVYDTRVTAFHVWEDWNRTPFSMVNLGGDTEIGSVGLKWQADFWGLYQKGEANGELELGSSLREMVQSMVEFAINNPDETLLPFLRKKVELHNLTAADCDKLRETLIKKFTAIVLKTGSKSQANLWRLTADQVAYYAVMDTVLTWRLYKRLDENIVLWGQSAVHAQKQQEMLELSYRMERNGILVDIDRLEEQMERYAARVQKLVADMQALLPAELGEDAIRDFNPGSPKQLIAVFEYMGVPLKNTDAETLRQYKDYPFVKLLISYRNSIKAMKTYLSRWRDARDHEGVVHPTMNSVGTVSGRWSSSGGGGNAQNIPDRKGYELKRVFVPPNSDWLFLAVDYGQLEARIASWIAEDMHKFDSNQTMLRLFNDGTDMHSYTRDRIDVRNILYPNMSSSDILIARGYNPAKLNQTDWDTKVAEELRQVAKTMNFGLLYSGGKRMLSKLLQIDADRADVLVQEWRRLFPAFPRANKYFERQALELRAAPSGFGKHYQYVQKPIVTHDNNFSTGGGVRKFHMYPTALRLAHGGVINQREWKAQKAWNNIVQGISGEICVASGLEIAREFSNEILRPFAQIHDALELVVHRSHLHIVPRLLDIMQNWQTNPRLTVDASASLDNWHDLRKIGNLDEWIASNGESGYK